jgi:hypothetical protein
MCFLLNSAHGQGERSMNDTTDQATDAWRTQGSSDEHVAGDARDENQHPSGNGATDPFENEVPPLQDPLENLFERVKVDVKVAYRPEIVAAMAALRSQDPGRYVHLYDKLKRANSAFKADVFNELIHAAIEGGEIAADLDATTHLLLLAKSAKLFVNQEDDEVFADFVVDGQRVTGAVRERPFRRWLQAQYFRATQRAPHKDAMQSALATLEASACEAGDRRKIFARIGHHEGRIYIDRGTRDWSAIEVDADGWRLVPEAPIKFVRPTDGIGELPVPVLRGKIEDLKPFLNLRSDKDFILAVGWILGCYLPYGAFPGLLMIGPHGSAKTTAEKRLCAMADPLTDDPWAPAREDREVLITAQRTHVQAFDNVTHISADRSAVYCRLSTGGKQRGRALYTDSEEKVLRAKRPMIMTSTRAVILEEDLADRFCCIAMGPVFEKTRRTEKVLDAEFGKAWPALLGAVLTAVSEGLRQCNEDPPAELPRMADYATWVHECEAGLGWERGTFLTVYREAIRQGAHDLAELDIVASALVGFMSGHRHSWRGTMTELLLALRGHAGERAAHSKDWPRSPAWLGRRLQELSTVLRQIGLDLVWDRVE